MSDPLDRIRPAAGKDDEIDLTDKLGEDRVILRRGERLVRFGGRLGVFRAVEDSVDDEDVDVLRRKVTLLGREVTDLESQRLALLEQLKALRRATPPAEFATAVSSALDDLSTNLTTMSNSTSDFAVREFALEAQVAVDVDTDGRLVYRFPLPEDAIDPQKLSKVTVRLVPLAREERTEDDDADRGGDHRAPYAAGPASASVEEIHGLGERSRRKLEAHGITTVADLIGVATRARAALELQSLLGQQRRELVGWLAQAELLTLPAMTGRTAYVLLEAGVGSLRTIVDTDTAAILAAYAAAAKRLDPGLGPIDPVDEQVVAGWKQAAAASPLLSTGDLPGT